ncbi:MAG: sigma-70 family RNA polymerase sigma factor, partial [Planctomycetales bacterium]|nr:sigma-70 family RNA polymerase sigma factor [Planctomycetales bacterium]
RPRLRRMIEVRMDPRVAARVDASDIVQDAIAEAAKRLPRFPIESELPAYAWLRKLAWERLIQVHREHLGAQKRSVRQEAHSARIDPSADYLATRFVAEQSSPSGRAVRRELCDRVRKALEELGPIDREVLVLRHLEQLTLREIAATLEISEAAAQSRYRRAVERAHEALADLEREL